MQLSVLIVEDEFVIAEDIRAAILSNGYRLFGMARSYDQALALLKKGRPDFVLLDITLGSHQAGLEIGKMLSEELRIPYIYVTSHSDTGTLERVKLTGPSGFLLKPFKREAIYAAIEVAMLNFSGNAAAETGELSVVFKKGEEKVRVYYSEILFFESDSNYTHVQTVTARFTERKTIKDLMGDLPDHPFIRVHKSFAVNRNKVRNFTRDRITIGAFEIPVGRAYYDELKSLS